MGISWEEQGDISTIIGMGNTLSGNRLDDWNIIQL